MIKSLIIENFQSHEHSEFEFHPNVNVIIGLTDSGKSAVFRAFRWVSRNKPTGRSICSNWGGKTLVDLETEIGFLIRFKDKEDIYELHRHGQKPLMFKAFGANVPEEIDLFLSFNEVNWQFQLDAPYLISKSPGEVAQHFNRVSHLDEIDTSLQKVNSWIRDLNLTIGSEAKKDKPATGLIKQIKETEIGLQAFDDLPKLEAELEVLEELKKQSDQKEKQISELETLRDNYFEKKLELEEVSEILDLEKPVNDLLDLYDQSEEKREQITKLNELISQFKTLETERDQQKDLLDSETLVNELLSLYDKRNELKEDISELSRLINYYKYQEVLLDQAKRNLAQLEAKFEKYFPEVCPLCGKPHQT